MPKEYMDEYEPLLIKETKPKRPKVCGWWRFKADAALYALLYANACFEWFVCSLFALFAATK